MAITLICNRCRVSESYGEQVPKGWRLLIWDNREISPKSGVIQLCPKCAVSLDNWCVGERWRWKPWWKRGVFGDE